MPAAKYNIVIEQGATFSRQIVVKDSSGDPVDLTGYEVRSQIRVHPSTTAIAATFDTTLNSPATDGVINWVLAATDSDAIDLGDTKDFTIIKYYYDFEIEDGSGNVTRILQGLAEIVPNVTK